MKMSMILSLAVTFYGWLLPSKINTTNLSAAIHTTPSAHISPPTSALTAKTADEPADWEASVLDDFSEIDIKDPKHNLICTTATMHDLAGNDVGFSVYCLDRRYQPKHGWN